MENIKAKFQLLDNYVKEYSIELKRKIQNTEEIEINGKIGFGILNVTKKEKLIGEIELTNEIDLIINEDTVGKINIVMGALFEGTLEIEEQFEEMLKLNGATTLSNLMRAYVASNTALSGMPTIILPLINFVDFFKKDKIENNKKN